MTSNHHQNRDLQQDAHAWVTLTGTKYTAALRQMRSPLAQGLLGDRVSARRLIATLNDHDLIGAQERGDPHLGESGYRSDGGWSFDGETDFVQLALIVDTLRMFTPIEVTSTPKVGSYSLKHTVEKFLSPHCPYVTNGRLIWAAAALGLAMTDPDGAGHNLQIGVSEREHDYVRRMVGPEQMRPRADHYRPPGYEHLQAAMAGAAAGELTAGGWSRPEPVEEPAPFHDWLVRQAGRRDLVGDLADDYTAGVKESDHRIAREPDDLLAIFHEVSHSAAAYDAVVSAIADWMRTDPSSAPIRTARVDADAYGHGGWGAGSGSVELYEYLCPCGEGRIVEDHENIPGFREHDVRIDCDKCRAEWHFVSGRGVRNWGLEPIAASGPLRT